MAVQTVGTTLTLYFISCSLHSLHSGMSFYYVFCLLPRPRYIGGRCIVFDQFLCIFLSLFICIFISLLARLRENGWTDLHEIFRESAEWPWDDLIQFWVKSEKPHDAAMLISLSATLWANRWTDLHQIFRKGVEWPWDDLITYLVNSDAQHGDGVCCAFAPQLVLFYLGLFFLGKSCCPILLEALVYTKLCCNGNCEMAS